MTPTDHHFKFEPGALKQDNFNRLIAVSVGVHVAVLLIAIGAAFIKPAPRTLSKAYLFDMVDVKPRIRTARAPKAPAAEVKPLKPVAPKPVVKNEKALVTRKQDMKTPPKEAPKEEKPAPPVQESETPPLAETASSESGETPVGSEMTIGQPDFPYSYYGAQVRNAVEQNWRQTPQELLGSEEQSAVTVKFIIQKNGKISDITITESSWNSLLDKLALRAIEKARIPPLPGEFQTLTITYRLVLRRAE